MKYCVTGGLGFIGNEVVRQLLKKGEVTVIDNYARVAKDTEDLDQVSIYKADITDQKAMEEIIGHIAPDVLIHLAAIHFIPECNANLPFTLRVNAEGTLSVLSACQKANVKHTLVASSGAVYADSPERLTEYSPVVPSDIYGFSKKAAEDLCTCRISISPTHEEVTHYIA
jgi:UDP-glucose 4-epimerase